MKFEKKSLAEIAGMSAEDQEKYMAAKEAHDTAVREKALKDALDPLGISVKTVEDAQKESAKDVAAIKDEVKSIGEQVKSFGSAGMWEDVSSVIEKHITENHEAIKSAFKTRGTFELDAEVMKVVGIVTTANGTLPVALPANYVAERVGVPNVRLRRPNLLDYVNTYNTNQKSLPYIEAVPGEGDFAVVLEGASKPQLDIDWVTRWAEPQKFAGWIKVTEEAIEDIPRLRDLIVNYLREKHDLFKESVVYTAINTAATAFVTTGGIAGTVTMPTIMDVVNALQLQIINTPNYTDEPDFFGDVVLMNVVDFYKYFGAAKDAFGRPLFENGYQGGRTFNYNGYTFVATTRVTAGSIILMDSTKVDVTTYSPYRVEIGWVNDDFIKNQFVILGESRGHIVIKNHDKRAFVKGSIATILTAITAPETP